MGIGETVLDILFKNDQPQKAVPGGSTFNSIVSLGRAGVPCAMVTEVGDDHIGDMTCRYLRENGVSDAFVRRHVGTKSHITLAFLDEHNDAQYIFYKDHASAALQMNALSVLGLLSRFVGMLTDSRSFLSYPRHEYFRRILCNMLGNDVEKGLLPDDRELLGKMVEDISYNNARRYFKFY